MKKLALLTLTTVLLGGCGADGGDPDEAPAVDRERAAWPIAPPRFTGDGDRIIDEVTGLVWELHGSGGWGSYDAAEGRCGELCIGGGMLPMVNCGERERMRVPTLVELQSLVDFAAEGFVRIDLEVFPDAEAGAYWTSTPLGEEERHVVDFATGEARVVSTERFAAAFVRCVGGGGVREQGYDRSAAEVVRDLATGLVWERTFSEPIPASEAEAYCAARTTGGFTDWRLPTVRELHSLFVRAGDGPQIDAEAFPGTPAELFWTATPVVGFPGERWVVDFGGAWPGAVRHPQTDGIYLDEPRVRCVR